MRSVAADKEASTQSTRNGLRSAMVALAAFVLVLTSCGSAADTATAAADEAAEATEVEADSTEEAEDHDDEDHDDEDHDDEDLDDHDDEDHDDHDDEDHDDSSGLGAHEHGVADLSVAWIDSDITVLLVSPTQNVFGFEYVAETDEDLATVAAQTEAITADGIVAVNESAGCELAQPASSELEQDGTHAEITVSWSFSCENPDEVSDLDLSALFDAFPGFEDIDAEWISDSSQSAVELTPDQPVLSFES